jgi:DNA-binding response OmpR family regulator
MVAAMPGRILLVEDDDVIGGSLLRALRASGYDVELAPDGAAARAGLGAGPDLVLLDLGLPDADGVDLCREMVARRPGLPVVILTARQEEVDVVVGLGAGAVDYVTKPFRLAELLARVDAHLTYAARQEPDRLVVGDLVVDRASHRAFLAGRELDLRAREFDLLARLAADAGRLVTRERLVADVWDEHWFGSTKTLDVHMAALRRKLGEEPGAPSRITTIRGVGYRLERP